MKLALALAWALVTATPDRPRSWLLDDFESPDHVAAHSLAWVALGDDLVGGASRLVLRHVSGGASASGHALRLEGSVGPSPSAFTGAWTALDGTGRPVDVSAFGGLRFLARGEGTFQAGLRSGRASGVNFMAPFAVAAEWRVVEIPFERLAAVGQGAAGAKWEPTDVHWLGISSVPGAHGPFALEIDDVELVSHERGQPLAPRAQPGPARTVRISLVAPPAGAAWRELVQDPAGDGKRPLLPDAVSVSVAAVGDRLWFRVRLAAAPPEPWLGLNIALDLDGDPANGTPWWGANTTFHFDRLVSVWLFKTGLTYQGVAGIADAQAVAGGDLMAGGRDVQVAIDGKAMAFLVGVPSNALGGARGPVRFVAAVGSALVHNDDVPDTGAVSLTP
jgi:Complex I intermediate-associated protein 30 (CIA30)